MAVIAASLAILVIGLAAPARAQAPTETVEYYGVDALGSVRVVFDASGNILGRMDYAPFGEELFAGTTLPSQRFAGLFRDGEAGLDHARARSYQSRTGRFSTTDPIYAGLFEPQLWNRYSYALNNPVTIRDPSGLCPTDYCETVDVIGYTPTTPTGQGYPRGGGGANGSDGMVAIFDADQTGGGGGGGGGTTSVVDSVMDVVIDVIKTVAKEVVCSALPDARVVGVSGGIGAVGATVGGAELLVNYNTGEASGFVSGGFQGGWNGVLSATLSSGFVFGLGNDNRNYSEWFGGGGIGVGPAGVSAAVSPTGVRALNVTAGVNLLKSPFTIGTSATYFSPPKSFGNVSGGLTGPDRVLFVAKQLCK